MNSNLRNRLTNGFIELLLELLVEPFLLLGPDLLPLLATMTSVTTSPVSTTTMITMFTTMTAMFSPVVLAIILLSFPVILEGLESFAAFGIGLDNFTSFSDLLLDEHLEGDPGFEFSAAFQ